MKLEGNNDVVFDCSRRSVYAHEGIFGLPIEGRLDVTYGYDGGLDEFSADKIGRAEKVELADRMIARWTEYKRSAQAEDDN